MISTIHYYQWKVKEPNEDLRFDKTKFSLCSGSDSSKFLIEGEMKSELACNNTTSTCGADGELSLGTGGCGMGTGLESVRGSSAVWWWFWCRMGKWEGKVSPHGCKRSWRRRSGLTWDVVWPTWGFPGGTMWRSRCYHFCCAGWKRQQQDDWIQSQRSSSPQGTLHW